MDMTYTTNPNLPRLRMQIALLVIRDNWSTRQVARHTGFNQSTIARWVQIAKRSNNKRLIPTISSRPHNHPHQLTPMVIQRIFSLRLERQQCAEILHYRLQTEGLVVSLSSIKRVLKRYNLIYPSKWKKWHTYAPRPLPKSPGILVEIDSMREGVGAKALCAYAVIDVCSRWAYAMATATANVRWSYMVTMAAQRYTPFTIQTLQSDHGAEFSKSYTKRIAIHHLNHRHTRIRKPTDNGHVERFIRTLQQECLNRTNYSLTAWQRSIPEYINYYNTKRPHMGLNMKTPLEVMQSY